MQGQHKYNDVKFFLIAIAFISAFNYYLTWSNIRLNWFLNLPESYWDVFNAGVPVNITPFQQTTVVSSKGDDGIACSTTDAVKFLKGLMEGKLLNAASMKEMFDFVKDEKGNKCYGMGMIYLTSALVFLHTDMVVVALVLVVDC